MPETTNFVKEHWDSRAEQFKEQAAATLEDQYLRELEVRTMVELLRERRATSALDVGCGNGYSTHEFARALPGVSFMGIDYSAGMIEHAKGRELPNCHFAVGDILDPASLPPQKFDVVLTQRCVQNILDRSQQKAAIRNLLSLVGPGGVLAFMECSNPGLTQFNRVSQAMSRRRPFKQVPVHNLWFDDEELVREFGAEVVGFCGTYMLCKAISPRLRALGFKLPQVGRFGYDRLYLIRPAA